MSCSNCTAYTQARKAGRQWGGYSMNCAGCCARLVRSARPLRDAQESIFAAIAMRPGRPTKEAVIAAIAQLDGGGA
jgi:hypothetical protein